MTQNGATVQEQFDKELGRILQLKRKDAGFTQTTLALEIGVHRNTLARWEDGEAGVPLWFLMRIAYVLRVQHMMFLPGRELVWGSELQALVHERDPLQGVEWERDPQLTLERAS